MNRIVLLLFIFFLGVTNTVVGQEEEHNTKNHKDQEHNDHEFKKYSLVFELGMTHIPDGYEDEIGDQAIWVPTLGLAYTYFFIHKWGAGLTMNMETSNYLVEFNGENLKRDKVLIIAALAKYEVIPNWGVFLGPGIEIEEHHNFFVVRIGTEYAIPLKKNWTLSPILTFDHKVDYTSREIALGIGKRF